MRKGFLGGSLPRIMGHELAGDIIAVGDGGTKLTLQHADWPDASMADTPAGAAPGLRQTRGILANV